MAFRLRIYVHRDYASYMYLVFHARGKQVQNTKLLIVNRGLVDKVAGFGPPHTPWQRVGLQVRDLSRPTTATTSNYDFAIPFRTDRLAPPVQNDGEGKNARFPQRRCLFRRKGYGGRNWKAMLRRCMTQEVYKA
jgi:hypothetical protein